MTMKHNKQVKSKILSTTEIRIAVNWMDGTPERKSKIIVSHDALTYENEQLRRKVDEIEQLRRELEELKTVNLILERRKYMPKSISSYKIIVRVEMDTKFNSWYAAKIKEFIKETNISKTSFAKICGVSRYLIYGILNEDRRPNWKPRTSTILKVKTILIAHDEVKKIEHITRKRKEIS